MSAWKLVPASHRKNGAMGASGPGIACGCSGRGPVQAGRVIEVAKDDMGAAPPEPVRGR